MERNELGGDIPLQKEPRLNHSEHCPITAAKSEQVLTIQIEISGVGNPRLVRMNLVPFFAFGPRIE